MPKRFPAKALVLLFLTIFLFALSSAYFIFFEKPLILAIASGYVALISFDSLFSRGFQLLRAKAYSRNHGKPMLNIGSGMFGYGDINMDIEYFDVPNFVKGSIEDMRMFKDKQFGSVYASHVLEHVDDPDRALKEMERVADKVFVVKPHFYDIMAWIFPGHKWIFFLNKKFRIH